MICGTFNTFTAYCNAACKLKSVLTTMLATLRTTNTLPASSPMTSLAGTRASAQPKKKYTRLFSYSITDVFIVRSSLAGRTNPKVCRLVYRSQLLEECRVFGLFCSNPLFIRRKDVFHFDINACKRVLRNH